MQRSVITNEYQLQEKGFIYEGHFGPTLKLEGMLENDEKDWQISRRGTGFVSAKWIQYKNRKSWTGGEVLFWHFSITKYNITHKYLITTLRECWCVYTYL